MRKIAIMTVVLMLLGMLSACGGAKLADIYDEDDVIARAKEVVGIINTGDYEAVVAQVREDLRDKLPAETLEEAWGPALAEAGAFEEYASVSVIGQKSKSTGEDYAVTVLTCRYENGKRIFTVSMDKDLAIVGLYMK